jgi:hypothetical protein
LGPRSGSGFAGASAAPFEAAADQARGSRQIGGAASLGLELRDYPARGTATVGARAALEIPLRVPRWISVRADGGAGMGRNHDVLGDVETLTVSGGLALLLAHAAGASRVAVGPRIELGWVRSRGLGAAAGVAEHDIAGLLAALSLVASVTAPVTARFVAACAVDVGGVLAGAEARADGRTVAGVAGVVVGVDAGVGYRF